MVLRAPRGRQSLSGTVHRCTAERENVLFQTCGEQSSSGSRAVTGSSLVWGGVVWSSEDAQRGVNTDYRPRIKVYIGSSEETP
eukprot:5832361-Pyramimonas_sp.AAC.1